MSRPSPAGRVERPLEIEVEAFDRLRREGPVPAVIDVREPWEAMICGLPEAVLVPLGGLAERLDEIPEDRDVVVVCHAGRRSLDAVAFLRSRGLERSMSLRGGLETWALRIDPTMPRY